MPPTRGAAFCTFLVVFCALAAFFWAAAADDAGFLLVLFVVFFVSFAALKQDVKSMKLISLVHGV